MSIYLKGLKHGDLGEATIIIGDPGRVPLLAEAFGRHSIIVSNREFLLMDGYCKNQRISVCSIGIGVDSTEICVSELSENKAEQTVRYGDYSAWRDDIEPDDIILDTGMARTTGLMATYVPDTHPAIANSLLASRVIKHLSGNKRIRIGLGLTTETYYIGQGKGIITKGKALPVPSMTKEWPSLGIMNCKMETAILYILASLYQISATSCLAVHVSRKNGERECKEDYHRLHYGMAQLVLGAILEPST